MLPKAYLSHRLKNRVRIHIPEKKKEAPYFLEIKKRLAECEFVEQVLATSLTGSVLIHFSGNFEGLLAYIKDRALFDLELTKLEQVWQREFFLKLSKLDKKILKATQGDFNLGSAAACVFLGLGVSQALRRNYLPPASTLIVDAFKVLLASND